MAAWLRRFGLHLAAAVGATGVFVAAAAVGANQTRQQAPPAPVATVVRTRTPVGRPKPQVVVATATPAPADNAEPAANAAPTQPPPAQANAPSVNSAPPQNPPSANSAPAQNPPSGNSAPAQNPPSANSAPAQPRPRPTSTAVRPERSLAGTIRDVQPNALDVVGVGGREWHIEPAPGALIRLNGKAVKLDSLQAGDGVVILGQAQPGPGLRFLAHAISAKSK